jgi:hypothetical protein
MVRYNSMCKSVFCVHTAGAAGGEVWFNGENVGIMSKYISIVGLFLFIQQAEGQYFIPLHDATGMELTVEEIAQLNIMAEDLVMTLPSIYQDGFRVYDLGVYRMHNYYADGVSAIVNQAIADTEKDYSLYMWYVMNAKGEMELFADYMFPEGEIFQCYDAEAAGRIRERVTFMRLSNRIMTRFEQEKRMIAYFTSIMEQLSQCCVVGNEEGCIDCDVLPMDIKLLMEEKEAVAFDLSILLPSVPVTGPESYITYYGGNPEIEIEASGSTTSIYELVREYLSLDVFSLGNVKAYITTDSNLCDIKISEILSNAGSMYFMWAHVSATYDKLWFYTVDNMLDEIVFSGCGSRQRSEGMDGPCIDSYFVVNYPLHDTIDELIIGYWITEIFARNGLDNISASVINADEGFRDWHDLWIETKFHIKGSVGYTDIEISPWTFYRTQGSKEETVGGTYVNVAKIEGGIPGQGLDGVHSGTDRHQVYAITAAHEYGHQLFFNARYFYTHYLNETRLIRGTVQSGNPVGLNAIHTTQLMQDGKYHEYYGIYDYINSNNPNFIYFNPDDIRYLKKYFIYYSRYLSIQSMDWPSVPEAHLRGLVNDARKYASGKF